LIKRLDEKAAAEIGAAQWEFIKNLVVQFVKAAEQRGVWDDLLKEGTAKKEWVKQQLDLAFIAYGLDVDWDAIDAAIEAALSDVKLDEVAARNGSARLASS